MNVADEVWWVVVAGAVAPYVISYLKAAYWTQQRKRLFAVGVSFALGVAAAVAEGGWDVLTFDNVEQLVVFGAGTWAAGQLLYDKLIEGTALERSAAQTSPGVVTLKRSGVDHPD